MTLRRIASLLLLALDVVIPKGAESKPFRKVLILSGGELRFSAGLAMLATLHQRGWFPDVTIYTCGFSKIPGAYLNSLTQLSPVNPIRQNGMRPPCRTSTSESCKSQSQ